MDLKITFKPLFSVFLIFLLALGPLFSQENSETYQEKSQQNQMENAVQAVVAPSPDTKDQKSDFARNFTSLEGHRFIEFRGAIPAFPLLTSHGAAQSFVAAFSDVFGEIITGGKDYEHTTPKFATDLNVTIFPPIADYRLGFMGGFAIDTWTTVYKKNDVEKEETLSMNFAYIGFHGDYGHWVFSEIGTRISIYGEVSLGWIISDNGDDKKYAFNFDICPFGIQFCPEKHIGLYLEIPHLGARPFFQTGVSIGL